MMESFTTITCQVQGPVATITLNRPEARNAMSHRMVEEMLSCFQELADESHSCVSVAVV